MPRWAPTPRIRSPPRRDARRVSGRGANGYLRGKGRGRDRTAREGERRQRSWRVLYHYATWRSTAVAILLTMQTDYVQRFLFEELDIRGRLTCLTGAWQRMLDGRDYPQDVASLLGHTTALNGLLGANQKGAGRVTLQVQGSGPVKLLVADCTSELRIRGMATYEKDEIGQESERELLGNGRMAGTLEDVKSGKFYQSLVPLEGETLQEIFAHYLSQSEQLEAYLRLYADGGALAGLLLEKLPNAATRAPAGGTRAPTPP